MRDLDMSAGPRCSGVLRIREQHLLRSVRVDDEWPDMFVERYDVPPLGATPAEAAPGRWEADGLSFEYGPVTRQDVLGPGSGWEHAFAVLRTLGQRFGDDGVRLVVWFD